MLEEWGALDLLQRRLTCMWCWWRCTWQRKPGTPCTAPCKCCLSRPAAAWRSRRSGRLQLWPCRWPSLVVWSNRGNPQEINKEKWWKLPLAAEETTGVQRSRASSLGLPFPSFFLWRNKKLHHVFAALFLDDFLKISPERLSASPPHSWRPYRSVFIFSGSSALLC